MIHVYMDDFRRCPQGFTLARTVDECLELLRLTEVDILSLDYDMGPGEKNGTDMAAAMVREGLFPREIYLHTSSNSGRKSMYEILYPNKPEHVLLHNGPISFERLDEIARDCKVPPQSKWICTANHGFAPYAQEELRRAFGSVKSTMLIPGEVFAATLQKAVEEVTEQLAAAPPVFLRHAFLVDWEWCPGEQADADRHGWLPALRKFLLGDFRLPGARVAVQTRKSEDGLWSGTAAEMKDALQNELQELAGTEFVVRDADWVISVFASRDRVYAGVARPEDNLSDWNGGAIRFRKEEGQISRAKFKLLEAEATFGIPFASFRDALDIGAAPGGWTSFLLERGLNVTAVDTAKLHPSLLSSPKLTFVQRNADSVKFKEHQFDLLVCDMSWSPKLAAKLVTSLLYALVPGGTAIVTVKLMHKKPMALIQEVIGMFQDARLQVQRAKQLFHNRDEITLYMIKY
ncbi:ribosomal RNA methyltransferase RrmJ/FtsJ [Paenibacillus macerans]|uniref:FtsJ-like methyltransferase family protein n=2 Tax=Paenibacillus macerans TaxID=44252 RepID=A0A090ZDL9_PAEMA|nr:cyclic-phosphate processing receiver domain-containing protein [Paenibacillus macerans]KFN08727.1 ftsJ-like methyltransferase family protein [Paenibacillus macerans]SUA83440.1 ribosomal RNA methyltransferase RrmJ/FtsJ [Paenibacillus macerans]